MTSGMTEAELDEIERRLITMPETVWTRTVIAECRRRGAEIARLRKLAEEYSYECSIHDPSGGAAHQQRRREIMGEGGK